jgi:FkbM family methyltransferase
VSIPEFVYTKLLKPKPLRALTNGFLRSIVPSELTVHNAKVALNPRDPVVSGALMLNVYEKPETKFFLAAFRAGMTFLDIGANVGYYTALALATGDKQSRVIAMEPDPESFQYLRKTVLANGGVNAICVNKAAADRAGSMTLFVSAENRGDNRLYDNDLRTGTCAIDAVRVDDLLDSLGVEKVDFIKMDVQGFEGHVLRGMSGVLGKSNPLVFMMEFWPLGLTSAGSNPADVLGAFSANRLNLYELTNRAQLRRIDNDDELIQRFPGRHYTNIVGIRNFDLPAFLFVS